MMKTWKKWFSAAALALPLALTAAPASATLANDGVTPLVRVQAQAEKSVALRLANLERKNTLIRITDSAGEEVYSTSVKGHNGYFFTLDLKALAPGRYLIQVAKGGESVTKVIRVTPEGILAS
jgi:hypothetical protein